MVGSNNLPYKKCICGHARSKHGKMWDRYAIHKCRVKDCNCKEFIQQIEDWWWKNQHKEC